MALKKLAYAELRVKKIEECLDFHQAVLGLVVIARESGRIFLSAGADTDVDLILTEQDGRCGAVGFAISADDEGDLADFERRLSASSVPHRLAADPLPGVKRQLSFDIPSGHRLSVVTLAQPSSYIHPSRGPQSRTRGVAPLDVDHITLRVDNGVPATMNFLRDIAGFKSSDTAVLPNGDLLATWMRVGDYHHDVAMFAGNEGESLDHLAWTTGGFDDIKRSLDLLARHGIRAEAGPGRHGIGGNLYAYFWAPGGNRYELTAEMPRLPNHFAEPVIWTDAAAGFSAWGASHPESFRNGS